MLVLSPTDEERALRIHREATVIDTLTAYNICTSNMLKCRDDLIARDADVPTILMEMDRLATQSPVELEPAWEELRQASGVNAVSKTVGTFGWRTFTYESAITDIAGWIRRFDAVERLVKVRKSHDIARAVEQDKFGVILNFQNTTHIGSDLDKLDFFYNLGIRIIQLTYNQRNLVGDGCTERTDCGLSRFGLEVVERMNKLGILVDVSHCGHQTTMDAIEASEVPVAVTHSTAKAVHYHDRGKTDEILEALAKRGGYFGVVAVPFLITNSTTPTLEHFLDHVDHVVKVMGVDKVGVGTDWDAELGELLLTGGRAQGDVSCIRTQGYDSLRDFPNITRGLVSRGYSDGEIKGMLGGNFLRLFKQVVG